MTHSFAHRFKRRGSALLEVLLASLVLAISLAALGALVAVGTKAAVRTNDQLIGLTLCRSVLDEQLLLNPRSSDAAWQAIAGHPGWVFQKKVQQRRMATAESVNQVSLDWLTVSVARSGNRQPVATLTSAIPPKRELTTQRVGGQP